MHLDLRGLWLPGEEELGLRLEDLLAQVSLRRQLLW